METPEDDRDRIRAWLAYYGRNRPAISQLIRKLLDGEALTPDERDGLVLFASSNHDSFPFTCEALSRVLDGTP